MSQDIRYALRMFLNERGFTVVVVVTLALGIGANTTIFSLVDALLFRPLPHLEDPARLVALYTAEYDFIGISSYMDYVDFRDRSRAFEELAAFKPLQMDLAGDGFTERIDGMLVTGNYFRALDVTPAAGRFFLPEEDRVPDAEAVVVLGYDLWQRSFGADPAIVGRSIVLHGRQFTVVGIAPRGFRGTSLETRPQLFTPMMMQPHFMPSYGNLLDNRGWGGILVVGRLAEGLTIAEAVHRVAGVSAWLKETYPRFTKDREYSLVPLVEAGLTPAGREPSVRLAALLTIVVALVLIVATVNVVNLLLARSTARRKELALRLALGASRPRLIRQLLVESTLLSLLGGSAGLLLAAWITEWIRTFPFPFHIDPALDARVLAFTFAVSVGTGVIFGLAPAFRNTGLGIARGLKDGVLADGGAPPLQWSSLLVVGQIGLSLLLLVTAGLFTQTLARLGHVELGFDPDNVVAATLDPAAQGYEGALSWNFFRNVLERTQSIPGVRMVSLVRGLPGPDNDNVISIRLEGQDPDAETPTVAFNVVGPSYFTTMRIPLIAGRYFSQTDFDGPRPTVIVNRAGARFIRSLTGLDPLGSRMSTEGAAGPFSEVVGIVEDSKSRSLREKPFPLVYFPYRQTASSRMTLLVRTDLDSSGLFSQLREAVREVDANVPLYGFRTLRAHLSASLFQEKLSAGLLTGFAALTLALAAVGLYGIVAYSVSRRTREFGIRLALGAEPRQITGLVTRRCLALTLSGVSLGLLAALATTRWVGSFLYEITATDPLTYVALSGLLGAVCLLATYVPARRAIHVDAVSTLRDT